MMYAELYQYLLQHTILPVPGIGTFLLERSAARVDFANKRIDPPAYAISLEQGAKPAATGFFSWLAHALQTTEQTAVIKFNDFAFTMKKQVEAGDSINWQGVGVLTKGLGGDIKLAAAPPLVQETTVPAEKVIREKAEHTVRVGEDQRTAAEMVEMLNHPGPKRSYWWAYAVAIAVLSLLFIGWHFSKNGIGVSATASDLPLSPSVAAPTYKILP